MTDYHDHYEKFTSVWDCCYFFCCYCCIMFRKHQRERDAEYSY